MDTSTGNDRRIRESSDDTPDQHRCGILVLGMHRSGTSALTRVLSMLGATLPSQLVPAMLDNPLGFFEPQWAVDIHERIFEEIGSSWNDWKRLDSDEYALSSNGDYRSRIADAVRQDFDQAPLFVVKDPRICRFATLWIEVLREVRASPVAVLPYRNPVEVAQSLAARNSISLAYGRFFWLRHVIDAEYQSRGIPRSFVSYDTLMHAPAETVRSLMRDLPHVFRGDPSHSLTEIRQFLNPELRHNHAGLADVSEQKLPDWARQAYDAYEMLSNDPYHPGALALLDGIRDAFNANADALAVLAAELEASSNRMRARHLSECTKGQDRSLEAQYEDLKRQHSKVVSEWADAEYIRDVNIRTAQMLEEKLADLRKTLYVAERRRNQLLTDLHLERLLHKETENQSMMYREQFEALTHQFEQPRARSSRLRPLGWISGLFNRV